MTGNDLGAFLRSHRARLLPLHDLLSSLTERSEEFNALVLGQPPA